MPELNRQVANPELPTCPADIKNWQYGHLGGQLEEVDCHCALNLDDFAAILGHHFHNFAYVWSDRADKAICLWAHEYTTDNSLNDSLDDQADNALSTEAREPSLRNCLLVNDSARRMRNTRSPIVLATDMVLLSFHVRKSTIFSDILQADQSSGNKHLPPISVECNQLNKRKIPLLSPPTDLPTFSRLPHHHYHVFIAAARYIDMTAKHLERAELANRPDSPGKPWSTGSPPAGGSLPQDQQLRPTARLVRRQEATQCSNWQEQLQWPVRHGSKVTPLIEPSSSVT